MIGQAIGPYEIAREIGRGGMGVVYLARDTKLDRDVAIKVLPDDVADDPERLARFEREAKLLASLRHANVAAVYGLEVVDGKRCLVLEYVDGEDLADRLQRGPLPMDEALQLAREIAEGVEAAHAEGIVHRDLKPGNIKITEGGDVKVLDFGLAKALSDQPTSMLSDPANSPTVITGAYSPTMPGVILGTAGYMSPEQARGRSVDRRSDIWSFGCILFEMLSGARIFPGETVTDSLGAILHKDPEWRMLPPETPATVRLLLRRCLAKDRRRRQQDIGDVRIELDEAIADPTGSSLGLGSAAAGSRGSLARAVPWVLTALLAAALVAGWFVTRPDAPVPVIRKLTLTIDEEQAIPVWVQEPFALSPDGSQFVFVGPGTPFTSLYIRRLDQLEARRLPNTDGASRPFFSPDGLWVAYANDDKLMRISTLGGPPTTLCDAKSFRGGAWSPDGTIIFAPETRGPLFRVLDAGGTPEPLTKVQDDDAYGSHRLPSCLPDGRGVLFTACGRDDDWDKTAIMVHAFETGEQKKILHGGSDGRYVPTGHVVYRHESTLMAVPFDLDRLETTGPSVPVLEGVAGGSVWNGAHMSFGRDGTMVYQPGSGTELSKLVWVDMKGFQEELSTQQGEYRSYSMSPDGERLAITVHEDADDDIWVLERQRDIMRPLTFDPADDRDPVWGPDGRWIVFASDRESEDDVTSLYRISTDFTGTPQRLTTAEHPQAPYSVSPDGRAIAFLENHPERNGDLYLLHLDEQGAVAGEPQVIANRPVWEWLVTFSPDGRWLLYSSAESGRGEVYVRPVTGKGAAVQVSTEGGFAGRWSPTEDRLFYTNFERMHSVRYAAEGDTFTPDLPEPLFALEAGLTFWNYQVSPDGQRFCWTKPADGDGQRDPPRVVLSWFDELETRLPAER